MRDLVPNCPPCRDSDLTARITGLEVRLARRSAEVEMLKAAVAACQADAETPSPPATPQVNTYSPQACNHPLTRMPAGRCGRSSACCMLGSTDCRWHSAAAAAAAGTAAAGGAGAALPAISLKTCRASHLISNF